MNQGAVQSSPLQQVVAAGSPGWWSINNIRPPQLHEHQSLWVAPRHHHFAHQLTPSPVAASWNDDQEFPESWSQLLQGGLVGAEDKIGLSHTQAKKLENWEQLLLNQTSNACGANEKQENSANKYTSGSCSEEFEAAKIPASCWSHQMILASSPKSCITTLGNNIPGFSPKSSDLKHPQQDPSSECNSRATGGASKKARIQNPSAQSTFKVRKEKLGDRITALHQLVSPFGKTDTASVLLEAIGYIRFLQSQIEALSLPYLGCESGSTRQHQHSNEKFKKRKGISDAESSEQPKNDLKSRGLCLVPISCTLHVGNDNGADYWAPAFGANFR